MARRELQQQAIGDLGGILAGYRNKVINGDFDHWQRATSQTSSGYASDDRWFNFQAGSTKTHSRQTHTLGQTIVPGNPKYFSRTVVTSVTGAGNCVGKEYRVEGVATLSGKTVTLTFYAKADAAKNIAISCRQNFGTGGSPSSQVITPLGLKALTTSFGRVDVTFTVPSVSGKTLGSNGDDFLAILIWFEAGSTLASEASSLGHQSGTFDISHVSLVEGDARQEADPFSPRHIAQELLLCERYYKGLQSLMGIAPNTTNVIFSAPNINMRTVPTVTLGSTAMMVSDIFANDFTGAGSAVSTTYSLTANGGLINMSGFTGLTAGRVYEMRDSNKIFFSAEL